MKTSLLALAFTAALADAPAAFGQTVINSVPFTISQSGKYVLGTNLITGAANQVAITISAPNVILDLNQFFVSGPGGAPASTTAVIRVANVSNVTIRNGTVANNGYGILFTGSTPNSINHLVENVNATRCTLAGIRFDSSTAGSVIRSNSVSQTGGNTVTASVVAAIYSSGGARLEDNTVTSVSSSNAATVSGIDAGANDFVIGNTVSSVSGSGIRFGVCQNNLTSACTTPFTTITNVSGNN